MLLAIVSLKADLQQTRSTFEEVTTKLRDEINSLRQTSILVDKLGVMLEKLGLYKDKDKDREDEKSERKRILAKTKTLTKTK